MSDRVSPAMLAAAWEVVRRRWPAEDPRTPRPLMTPGPAFREAIEAAFKIYDAEQAAKPQTMALANGSELTFAPGDPIESQEGVLPTTFRDV